MIGPTPKKVKLPAMCTSLRLKVFGVENKDFTLRMIKPKHGKYWDAAGVDNILDHVATDLEERFPNHEYKLVQVGKFAFNFVFVRTREIPAERIQDGAPEVGVQSGESRSE